MNDVVYTIGEPAAAAGDNVIPDQRPREARSCGCGCHHEVVVKVDGGELDARILDAVRQAIRRNGRPHWMWPE